MNKGLAVHIIATLIYALLVVFVVQDEPYDMQLRCLIVFLGIIVNCLTALICGINNLYENKQP